MNSTAQVFRLSVLIDAKTGDTSALRATLQALAAVRRTRIEICIDGPCDRSAAIDDLLIGFAQKFARVEHCLISGSAVERATNLITRTGGDYVLFLRAGDRPTSTFLQACSLRCTEMPVVDICYAALATMEIGGDGHITQMHVPQSLDTPLGGRAEFAPLLSAQHISWRGTLIRRALFDELGPLAADRPATADWEFLLRVAEQHGYMYFAGGIAAFVMDESYAYFEPGDHRDYFDEIISLYDRYLTLENEVAVRGTAQQLSALVEAHVQSMRVHDAQSVDLALDIQTASLKTRAAQIAAMPVRAHTPLISVVLAGTVSPPHIIARALDSLAAQTRQDFEIIFVRSGGIDFAAWIASHPLAERIRYVHVPGLPDLATARLIGRSMTRGSLISYLDDDHVYRPEHLEILADRLLRSESDMVYSGAGLCIEQARDQRGGEIVHRLNDFRNATQIGELVTVVPALSLGGIMHRARCHAILTDTNIRIPLLGEWYAALWLISATKTCSAFVPQATYDIYVPLGLAGTELGTHGPVEYLRSYDSVCARVASGRANEELERSRIRAQWLAFMPQWDARVADSDALLAILRTMGTQPIFAELAA